MASVAVCPFCQQPGDHVSATDCRVSVSRSLAATQREAAQKPRYAARRDQVGDAKTRECVRWRLHALKCAACRDFLRRHL
jgi:hypothetical protein